MTDMLSTEQLQDALDALGDYDSAKPRLYQTERAKLVTRWKDWLFLTYTRDWTAEQQEIVYLYAEQERHSEGYEGIADGFRDQVDLIEKWARCV